MEDVVGMRNACVILALSLIAAPIVAAWLVWLAR